MNHSLGLWAGWIADECDFFLSFITVVCCSTTASQLVYPGGSRAWKVAVFPLREDISNNREDPCEKWDILRKIAWNGTTIGKSIPYKKGYACLLEGWLKQGRKESIGTCTLQWARWELDSVSKSIFLLFKFFFSRCKKSYWFRAPNGQATLRADFSDQGSSRTCVWMSETIERPGTLDR